MLLLQDSGRDNSLSYGRIINFSYLIYEPEISILLEIHGL
jgi:hypothetical protein